MHQGFKTGILLSASVLGFDHITNYVVAAGKVPCHCRRNSNQRTRQHTFAKKATIQKAKVAQGGAKNYFHAQRELQSLAICRC
jgi:hypothetical protein